MSVLEHFIPFIVNRVLTGSTLWRIKSVTSSRYVKLI